MYEIPLFPLNTVLFPGMPLTLHIFEERYKEMINLCLHEQFAFGVVLIRHGQEADGWAEPYKVGCTAVITHLQSLNDGQMNLLVVGQERFEILSLKHDKPYLTGVIEHCPLKIGDIQEFKLSSTHLRPLVEQYLQILADASDVEFDMEQLPTKPLEMAFLAASLVQTPVEKKQSLLEINNIQDFISSLHLLYRQELSVLRMMLELPNADNSELKPFSLN